MKRSVKERDRKTDERAARALFVAERERKSGFAIRAESKPQEVAEETRPAARWSRSGKRIR